MPTQTITSGGTYIVQPGWEYIIAPSVEGDVKFEPPKGYSGAPIDFTVTIDQESSNGGKDVKIKIYGDENKLSPTINIDDNLDLENFELDLEKAADTKIVAGDNVTIGKVNGSKDGPDDITFGDNATFLDYLDTNDGDDTIVIGNDARFEKGIDTGTGPGNDSVVIGDDAFIGSGGIKTGDGDDTITIGNGADIAKGIDSGDGADSITIGDGGVFGTGIDAGKGADTILIGDDNSFAKIDTGDGADAVTIGDGNTFEKEVKTGQGADTVIIGDGNAFLDKLTTGTGDEADIVDIGDNTFIKELETKKGADTVTIGKLDYSGVFGDEQTLDGYKGGISGGEVGPDVLNIDLSDLTPAELDDFTDLLESEGYYFQPGIGFVANDDKGLLGEGLGPNEADYKIEWEIRGQTINLDNWEVINVVCFARGTKIMTPKGEVRIEDLSADDEVLTMDSGYQKIRWIGNTTVPAKGHLAPVRIKAGAIGNTEDLVVSPQHRVLLKDSSLEILFGQNEALVAAKHLVNGETILIDEGGEVEYFHMLFDDHEIVYAQGIPSESFHPGVGGMNSMASETRREILELFPELATDVANYGPSCRMSLKAHEAKLALQQLNMHPQRQWAGR